MRALKHRRESNGLKSHRTSPLSYEEKRKCSIVRLGAEFLSIGGWPEAKANRRWPNHGGDTP